MAVTVRAVSDLDPCPRVEITADAVVGASTLSVTRLWDGETATVRGARRVTMQSPTYLVDYEVPLGVEFSYIVTFYSSTGAVVGTQSTAQVTAQWVELDELAIVQAPLAPRTAMPVLLYGSAAEALTYSRDLTYALPIGTSDRVAFGGPMRDAEDVPFSMYARNGAEDAALRTLLRRYMPLLVRSVEPVELPRVCYAGIKAIRRVPIHRTIDGWTGYEIALDQVRAPAVDITVPAFMYSDVEPLYAGLTYAQAEALRPGSTYLDWERDPRP